MLTVNEAISYIYILFFNTYPFIHVQYTPINQSTTINKFISTSGSAY